jgi:hypothetical protein
VLIGRDRELRAITNAWRRRRRGVLVTGPPGMGRTAFADGVAALLQADGADVMRVRGTLTSRAVRLWALAPHLASSAPDVGNGPARDLGDELRSALAARASGRFAAVVDDAHLLDDASGRLLAQLLDTPNGFVVATADDRHVDGPLLLHPALEPLQLPALDAAGVARLLLARGAPDVDPAQALVRSGGNPTALLRFLATASGGGGDAADGGIDTVLARLSPGARRALEMIAVAEPLSPAALATALDGDVRAAIDELVATGLVEETHNALDEVELRFVHPADAALVVALMAPLRVRAVVRRAVRATRTERRGRTPESLVRLAGLATRVGEALEPAELRAAAATARTGDDGDLALRLARCTAAATGDYDDVRVWADLAYERGAMDDLDAALSRLHDLVERADVRTGRAG